MGNNPPTVRTLDRLVAPVWRGCSPLLAFIFALLLYGIAIKAAQGWHSFVGDGLWLFGFLLVSLYAATEPGRPKTALGRASMGLLVMLGISASALQVDGILVNSGQMARSGTVPYSLTIAVLGVLAILARIIANRQLGQHQSGHEQ